MGFPFVTVSVSRAQLLTDNNMTTIFDLTGGSLTYTLPLIGTFPITNGWFQFIRIKSTSSTQVLSIVPSGGNLINSDYDALHPLRLQSTADQKLGGGILSCDGNKWYFSGMCGFGSNPGGPLGSPSITPFNYNLPPPVNQYREPLFRGRFLQCLVAEAGYAIGDVIDANAGYASANVVGSGIQNSDSGPDSDLNIIAGNIVILNKTTGVIASLTPADWGAGNRFFFRHF